ncbi:GH92 family glycosyl hydrolase [Rapidithrix thailandica]|uniref:GH92 family glycosyl hydrolase n=1 Tax=Rapidithrix thailandica TaxID=413964 RepID=A0AAW9SEK8_9BACT
MKQLLLAVAILSLFANCQNEQKKQTEQPNTKESLTQYVNTFIGTDGPGNTYPGAVVPFGMVQLSPDNGLPGWDRIAGYFWPDTTIAGFSHTHLTGTGAGDLYDLLVMPLNSRFTQSLPKAAGYRPYSTFSHEQEEARPGYYKVHLQSSGIDAELTVTPRVGFHRYTFPEDANSQLILDLGYSLNWDGPTETHIQIENENTISGYRMSSGWAADQRVYFVAQFSKPFEKTQLYQGQELVEDNTTKGKSTKFIANYATSEGEQILMKVALSSASIEGARKNLEAELPKWDFDATVKQAEQTWEKALNSIRIKGSDYQKELFYTNLYHLFLTPSLHSDVDGQYKGADGKTQQAKGFKRYDTFSLWDTYRTAHPLYTLLTPDHVGDFVKSFLAHYEETGLLPVWSMAGNETNMMIGYHAVPVIVDAYFKGIELDAEKAYAACKASATVKDRGIDEYMEYGYIPFDGKFGNHWVVSMVMEYAYDDWCIAQFAKALGKEEDYRYFSKRADSWKNLYDASTTFIRPKDKNGKFLSPFVAKEYTEYYCESNAWQYFWHVQHDIPALIDTLGQERFAQKLDSMFTYYPATDDELPIFSTGMIGQYAHGNEPSHHVAFLYNHIGQPWKTQELVRRILDTQYSNKPDGYCGNEDCGQMSAWLLFSAMGMYPTNPANGIYDLTSPWVEEAQINLPNGKIFTVKTENQAKEHPYIQEIRLNGEVYTSLNIRHQQLIEGGELVFVLGEKPVQ